MTVQIYASYVAPALIVAMGLVAYLVHGWWWRRELRTAEQSRAHGSTE